MHNTGRGVEQVGNEFCSSGEADRRSSSSNSKELLLTLAQEDDPLLLYLLASNPEGPHENLSEICLKAEAPGEGLRWIGKELLTKADFPEKKSQSCWSGFLHSQKSKRQPFLLREIAALPQLNLEQKRTLRSRGGRG